MNYLKTIITLTVILGFLPAQTKKYGGGPYSFYKISFTPRETAMGGTGVASSTGPFSAFWNPANIIDIKPADEDKYIASLGVLSRAGFYKGSMFGKHDLISNNFDFNCVSMVYRPQRDELKKLAIGFSFVNKIYRGIQSTSLNVNNQIVENNIFDISETMFLLSPAFILGHVKVGTNMRFGHFSYPGVNNSFTLAGFDLGTQMKINEYLFSWQNIENLWQKVKNSVFGNTTEITSASEENRIFKDMYFGMTIFFDRDDKNIAQTIMSGISLITKDFDNLHDLSARMNVNLISGTYDDKAIHFGLELKTKPFKGIRPVIRSGFDSNLISAIGAGVEIDRPDLPIHISLDISYSIPFGFRNEYNYNLKLVDEPLKFGLQLNWSVGKNI